MTTYTTVTDSGLLMWRENIFATKTEADEYITANPTTENGTPQLVVTTEQAIAIQAGRAEVIARYEEAMLDALRKMTAKIIAS